MKRLAHSVRPTGLAALLLITAPVLAAPDAASEAHAGDHLT